MKVENKESVIKNINAITLIALVVTIIILIILAGVSINLILGQNGIVKKAKEGAQNYQTAVNEEQDTIIYVEQYINSNETSTSQLKNILKVGDYIKYNTGSQIEENGIVLCRVLYNDKIHGLQIITDKSLKQTINGQDSSISVVLSTGEESYNSVIETLNNRAEEYLNTTYAYDARCVGSLSTIATNGMFDKKDNGTTTTVVLPPSEWTSYTRPDGWENDDTGCFDSDTNYTDDQTAMTEAGLWEIGEYYWLASRYVYTDSTACNFYVNCVSSTGAITYRKNYVWCKL